MRPLFGLSTASRVATTGALARGSTVRRALAATRGTLGSQPPGGKDLRRALATTRGGALRALATTRGGALGSHSPGGKDFDGKRKTAEDAFIRARELSARSTSSSSTPGVPVEQVLIDKPDEEICPERHGEARSSYDESIADWKLELLAELEAMVIEKQLPTLTDAQKARLVQWNIESE